MCGTAHESGNGDGPGGIIERGPLEKMVDELLKSRTKDRAKMPGLDDQRKDQIIAGALLVRELFDRLKLKRIHLVWLGAAGRHLVGLLSRVTRPTWRSETKSPTPAAAASSTLARRCDWHKTHSEQVASLTLQLFDELRRCTAWRARARADRVRRPAARHRLAHRRKGHHKHSMYLIDNGDLKPFTTRKMLIMANIAAITASRRRRSRTRATWRSRPRSAHRGRRRRPAAAGDGLDRSHSRSSSACVAGSVTTR
jgi:exopolyphosphatase/guanosine-5'-triphosphate,3'-diphosphate pyrophosphatase